MKKITPEDALPLLKEMETLNVKSKVVGGVERRGYSFKDLDIKVETPNAEETTKILLSGLKSKYPFCIDIFVGEEFSVFYQPWREKWLVCRQKSTGMLKDFIYTIPVVRNLMPNYHKPDFL